MPANSLTANIKWQTIKIALQTGTFEFVADVVPSGNKNDTIIGASFQTPTGFSDVPIAVRFNNAGGVDARDASTYRALTLREYSKNKSYHLRVAVDLLNHVYSVFITAPGQPEVQIAASFNFRTEQINLSEIQYLCAFSDAGTAAITNFAITSSAPPSPVPPVPPVTPTPPNPPAPTPAKPDATNTGPSNAKILTRYSGPTTITTPNTIIQNAFIVGQITIKAAGVVLKNFTLDAQNDNYGIEVVSGDVTAQDGEIINANGAAIQGNNWTALRLNVHEMGSDAFNGGGHNTLQSCYIHNLGMNAGAHADGIQCNNGDHIVIRGNNFDLPWWDQGDDGQVYRSNSCIFLNGYVYNYLDGTVVDGNWLNGGNYTIYALGQTNTTVSNNIFGSDYQYGRMNGKVATWKNNVDTAGATV